MTNLYSTISHDTLCLGSKISESYQEKMETMLKQHFGGKQGVVCEICKWRIGRERRSKKARNNFCSERVESIPFLYLVPAFLSPRKAAAPLLLSYLSPGGGVLCILLGVL